MRSWWLIGSALLVVLAVGYGTLAHYKQKPPTGFNYVVRPRGYHWRSEFAPTTHDVVWYGKDPTTGWTVYVGPDGVYYTFNHPKITPRDLGSRWQPHDVP